MKASDNNANAVENRRPSAFIGGYGWFLAHEYA
jgi:hypothetical protein